MWSVVFLRGGKDDQRTKIEINILKTYLESLDAKRGVCFFQPKLFDRFASLPLNSKQPCVLKILHMENFYHLIRSVIHLLKFLWNRSKIRLHLQVSCQEKPWLTPYWHSHTGCLKVAFKGVFFFVLKMSLTLKIHAGYM